MLRANRSPVCLLLLLSTIGGSEAGQTVKVLALFSSTNNDLGLDHQLGRQVLKLAAERAKRLHPEELEQVELSILSDQTECSKLNSLPGQVAQHFYQDEQLKRDGCGNKSAVGHFCQPEGSRLEAAQLRLYLDHVNKSSALWSPEAEVRSKFGLGKLRQLTRQAKTVDAIIGPSCDFLVDLIARMAAYWRTPIYSVASINANFGRKDIYQTLTRLSPSIDHLIMFILKTLEKFKWRHLAILVDDSQAESSILLDNLERTIGRLRYTNSIEHKVFKLSTQTIAELLGSRSTNGSLSGGRYDESKAGQELCNSPSATETLVDFSKVARVMLLLLNNNQLIRKLLLCAHRLHMNNGEYTFMALNLGLRSSQAQTVNSPSQSADQQVDRQQRQLQQKQTRHRESQSIDWFAPVDEQNNLFVRQMFESLMVYSVELPVSDEFNLFVEQVLDMAHQEFPDTRFERSSVGTVAVALHDSLLLAVEAQLRARRSNSSEGEPQLVSHALPGDLRLLEDLSQEDLEASQVNGAPLMWNQHYSGGLFASMHINSNGDQELDYVLSDLEPDLGVMRPVASYSKDTRQVQLIPGAYIHWPRRLAAGKSSHFTTQEAERGQLEGMEEPPADEPECGFTGEAERCVDRQNLYAALALTLILAVLVLIASLVSLYKYRKIKYQIQLDDYWWKISWHELQFIQNTGSVGSNAQSVARMVQSGSYSVVSDEAGGSEAGSSFVRLEPKRRTPAGGSIVSGADLSVSKQTKGLPAIAKLQTGREGRKASKVEEPTGTGKLGNNKRRPALIVTSHVSDENFSKQGTRIQSEAPVESLVGSLAAGSFVIKSEYSSVVRCSNLAVFKG